MNKEQNKDHYNDEIDLKELFLIAWKKKYFIIITSAMFGIASVLYALSLPNFYTSNALLAPASDEQSLSSKLGGVSGLASLAGVGLPSASATKTQEALERIKSYNFFSNHFLPNIQLENLVAVESWNSDTNTISYNKELFDVNSSEFIKSDKFVNEASPSNQKAYEEYKRILGMGIDDSTGFVSISIEHYSPVIAKEWLDLIIFNINESMRELDKQDAQNAIDFLNESSKYVSIMSIKEVMNRLLENKMQTLMLAASNKAYVFKILDSPIIPEIKSGPFRSIICILGTILGGFLSLLTVIVHHYIRRS